MHDQNSINKDKIIEQLDQDREWLLKNIDSGKWPNLRTELASLEREISKLILRVKEYNSENNEQI
tara:strand:- start:542 stop:736 length:195 start_codon:yes stop_codon:yes gene_type:complete